LKYCRRGGSFAGSRPDFVERVPIKRHSRHGPDVTQQQAHSGALIRINNPRESATRAGAKYFLVISSPFALSAAHWECRASGAAMLDE
jgi:hypothetical protein